jgi:hypothetical protein
MPDRAGWFAAKTSIEAGGNTIQASKRFCELRLVGETALEGNLGQGVAGISQGCGSKFQSAGAKKVSRGTAEKSPEDTR